MASRGYDFQRNPEGMIAGYTSIPLSFIPFFLNSSFPFLCSFHMTVLIYFWAMSYEFPNFVFWGSSSLLQASKKHPPGSDSTAAPAAADLEDPGRYGASPSPRGARRSILRPRKVGGLGRWAENHGDNYNVGPPNDS